MIWVLWCVGIMVGFGAGYMAASWDIERTIDRHLERFNRERRP